jgi:hypothetical protein
MSGANLKYQICLAKNKNRFSVYASKKQVAAKTVKRELASALNLPRNKIINLKIGGVLLCNNPI